MIYTIELIKFIDCTKCDSIQCMITWNLKWADYHVIKGFFPLVRQVVVSIFGGSSQMGYMHKHKDYSIKWVVHRTWYYSYDLKIELTRDHSHHNHHLFDDTIGYGLHGQPIRKFDPSSLMVGGNHCLDGLHCMVGFGCCIHWKLESFVLCETHTATARENKDRDKGSMVI